MVNPLRRIVLLAIVAVPVRSTLCPSSDARDRDSREANAAGQTTFLFVGGTESGELQTIHQHW